MPAKRKFGLFLISSLIATVSVASAATQYPIQPHSLSDGYEISGGYIETDGTIGLLSPANITGYSVDMSGPIPYSFNSATAGTSLSIVGDILADANAIWVGIDSGSGAALHISTTDNSTAGCQDCHQDLVWLNSSSSDSTRVTYDHHDHSDDMPDSGFRSFELGSPQSTLTVATPEPAGCGMLLIGLISSLLLRRRR